MSLEAISMEPIGHKLRNLRDHLPNLNKTVYDFAAYLADRLGTRELLPEGFNMEVELTFHDLRTGVNGWTGKPVPSNLSGYPPQLYAVLKMYIPKITDAVCPPEFAQAVKQVQEEVSRMVRESQ